MLEVVANNDENNGDGFWNTKPFKTKTCKLTHVKQASEHTQKTRKYKQASKVT